MSSSEIIQRNHLQRNVSGVGATTPPGRALNLHALWLRPPADPDFRTRPFFSNPILNRAIITKHNVRPDEESRFDSKRLGATKVVLPFDPHDLSLGAQYLFVGQKDFSVHLSRLLDHSGLNGARDMALIEIIDQLPSLDPFLLHQLSRHYRLNIAPCYFRMPAVEMEKMSMFVAEEIEPLLILCLGSASPSTPGYQRMIGLLIDNDQDSQGLAILQDGLRMGRMEFSQAMFAWKALLYYKWRLREMAPVLKRTASAIGAVQPDRRAPAALNELAAKRLRHISSAIAVAWSDAAAVMTDYDAAYRAMTRHKDPRLFREFLANAQHVFMSLGDRVGRLDLACSYWSTRFPSGYVRLDAEEMCVFLTELDNSLCTELSLPSVESLTKALNLGEDARRAPPAA